MDNNNALTLATTRNFNGHTLNCYVVNNPDEKYDFWATREQIGQFLGYKDPTDAIAKIHKRNRERLDRFSGLDKLSTPEGGTQQTRIYSFKGLLEICRFSNQPNANKVIDILWDIAEEVAKKGYYIHPSVNPEVDKLIAENKLLREKVGELIKQIETDRSFTVLGRVISIQHGLVSFSEAGKVLAQNGVNIGPNKLLKLARDKGLLCKCKGRRWNQPTQKAIKDGTAVLVLNFGSRGTAFLTAKGLQRVTDEFVEQIYPLLALCEGGETANA